MSPIRFTSRRLLFCFLLASLLFSLLGIWTLQQRSDTDYLQFLKFEQRAAFPDKVPMQSPIEIKSPKDEASVRYAVQLDKPVLENKPEKGNLNEPNSGKKATSATKNVDEDKKVDGNTKVEDNSKMDQILKVASQFDPKFKIDPNHRVIYGGSEEIKSELPAIPKMIHQTWSSYNIPKYLVNWVTSFVKVNPDYEFWFWTDKDALDLVTKKYPSFLKYYNKYPKAIQRADVMRYFVLHEFGGFYSDMDISALKSFEPLRKHSCIVSQEPWVHAKVYWGLEKLLPCNAFLASAPGHPFMRLLIDTIPFNFERNDINDVMDKTGPMMVNRVLGFYEKIHRNFTDFERVYLAEPNLFHPRYDPNLRSRYIQGCDNPKKYHLSESEVAECGEQRKVNFKMSVPSQAYTDHHWMHFWVGGRFVKKVNPSQFVHIKQVIPTVRNVSEIIRNYN